MPYSSARRKSSSSCCASASPRAQRRLLLEATTLLVGIIELAERVGELAVLHEQLPPLDLRRVAAFGLGERRQRER